MEPAKGSGEAGDRPAEWTLIKVHTLSAPGAQSLRSETDTETQIDSRRHTHTDRGCHRGMEESPASVKTEQEAGRKLRASEI